MQLSKPTLAEEEKLWKNGYNFIAGLDEVGRGSWAGPVVVAAVIFQKDFEIPENLRDSKQVKPRMREKLSEKIKNNAKAFSIGEISVSIIDRLGIGIATQMAFRKALRNLLIKPDFLLVDAFYIKHINRKNQKPIKKGDEKCASIAAASILAKVHRDSLMRKLAKDYPEYGFARHKGYGTRIHQEAIKRHNLSQIHRRSFNLSFLS